MQWLDNLVDKWEDFKDTPRPGLEKTGKDLRKTGKTLAKLWEYIYKVRGLILAIPVLTVAIVLAFKCAAELPQTVMITLPGIDTASPDSLFGFLVYHTEYISRSMAVMAPMIITVSCLLLTLCSKRVLYPWLISVFSLIVPLFLLLTNTYL